MRAYEHAQADGRTLLSCKHNLLTRLKGAATYLESSRAPPTAVENQAVRPKASRKRLAPASLLNDYAQAIGSKYLVSFVILYNQFKLMLLPKHHFALFQAIHNLNPIT